METLSREDKLELLKAFEEKERRLKENKILAAYPDDGPFARKYYPKQLEFFKAGSSHKERAFIAGNRTGKSESGSFEMSCHLTGIYPHWWEGKRFDHAINAIAAGKTNQTTKDIIQEKLLGNKLEIGTGMIPKDRILRVTSRAGVADAVLDVYVNHISGGVSHLVLKSYEQGRGAFEGTSQHVIWFDEEPEDKELYSEALVRTATTKGIMFCTFTPLYGISDIVLSFLPDGMMPKDGIVDKFKYVVMASWTDVPHIPEDEKAAILASTLPHQIEARSKGIPSIGEGKIYPVSETDILCDLFTIPNHWPRAYAMDVGWKKTAVIWGAIDPNTETVYLYDEYYRGHAEPAVHVSAIKARGDWIRGAIDYAGGTIIDGQKLTTTQQYYQLGLNVIGANKAVDAGILCVYRKLCEGKLKIFKTCQNWIKEYRIYRRDQNGKIVKENDHLMDATRYFMMTGINLADVSPDDYYEKNTNPLFFGLNRNEITGY